MREIKFRAWDNEIREFISGDYEPISVGDSKVVTGGDWQGVYYTDKYTIEQYTGLKDKNSREIYEGDIVKDTEDKFADTGVVKWDDVHAGFLVFWSKSYYKPSLINADTYVIGNIHENEELLEEIE